MNTPRTRTAETVADQRQRRMDRKTFTPLPDTFTAAVVGPTWVAGYPESFAACDRERSRRYWANGGAPDPLPCILVRNPSNQYDANAVEVRLAADTIEAMAAANAAIRNDGTRAIVAAWLADGARLGHLPRDTAASLAPELDAGAAWSCELTDIFTSPENVSRPGAKVRCTRTPTPATTPEPVDFEAPKSDAEIMALIAEYVADMSADTLAFELMMAGVEPAESIEDRRADVMAIYVAERAKTIARACA